MSDVTVKQLAGVLGISTEKLMEQLASAGIPANSEDDGISNESKVKLLEFLRGSHGKDKKSLTPRKKVVLKRKSTEVLRVSSGSSGMAKTKSINIEVKKKKLTTGPSQKEVAEIEQERLAAQQALDERKVQLEAEEKVKQAAAAELAAQEKEKQAAQALEQAEKERLASEKEQAELAAQEQTDSEAELDNQEQPKDDSSEETEVKEEVVEKEVEPEPAIDEEAEKKKRHDELVNQQVQKAITDLSLIHI